MVRITARLEPGAAEAFDALLRADGATVTTAINRAVLDAARGRGLWGVPQSDLSATVERLVADVAELRRIVADDQGPDWPAAAVADTERSEQ